MRIKITLVLERDRILTALERQELWKDLEEKYNIYPVLLVQEENK
jgi:hypothetical protein